MKQILSMTMLAAALMLPAARADTISAANCAANPCPTIVLTVGGNIISPVVTVTPVSSSMYSLNWNAGGANGYQFSGTVNADTDPQVSYGITFANTSNTAQDFTATVMAPFTGGPYTVAFSTYSGSVTDNGDGMVSVTPSAGLTAIHNPDATGVGSFGAIVGGCSGAVAPHSSTACGQENMLNLAVLSAANGVINISIGARVSAGDIFTLNGTAGLDNTPEPATYGLLAGGLCFAGLFRRRRK